MNTVGHERGDRLARALLRFVKWYCPQSLHEGIEGDILEQYEADLAKWGRRGANGRLLYNSLRFFRPSIIFRNRKRRRSHPSVDMLKNYFKLTLRTISRSKGYSFINIFGLSLGIACCLLTTNYVIFEFSYDDFHPNVDRTYRVDQTLIWDPEGGVFGSTGLPLASLMTREYPEVEETTRINTPGNFVVRTTDEKGNVSAFNENYIFAADSNFFHFFGFRLKEGNPATALYGVDKVVISSEVARKLFGDSPALGRTIQMGDDRRVLEVTGVTEEQPENSHLKFKYLMSMYTNPAIRKFEWSWIWTQAVTYVRLKPGADAKALQAKMISIGEKTIKPSFERFGINYDDFMAGKGQWQFYLVPVRDIHLKSQDNRLGSVGDIRYPYAFGAIGVFVLVIAGINFVNLSTARATKRAREVGVKKALGALRSSLMTQFQAESIFLAIFSTLLAVPLVELLRIGIVTILQSDMPFTLWNDSRFLIAMPVVALVIGLLAGIYPAFYLTSFIPVEVLKGKISSNSGNTGLRNALVVLQFAISIMLLIGTVVIVQQMDFVRSANLGFNKENTLVVNYAEKLGGQLESFRDEVATLPGVTGAAIAQDLPRGSTYQDVYSAKGSNIKLPVTAVKIDDHYFQAMGFQLVAGRLFDVEHNAADQTAFIANETVVRLFGWTPEDAIGRTIIYEADEEREHVIIGVVKDFHFQSLRQAINPLFFNHVKSKIWGDMRVVAVKYNTDDLPELVRTIENKWNTHVQQTPMDVSFLEDDLANNYKEDRRLGDIFAVFAGLSILIALIGLVGLVAYSAEVRKKEIGIRKVLGASRFGIVAMMNGHYMKLIAIGLVISIPVSWTLMNYWLETFEYRLTMGPMIFIGAGVAVIITALMSVGYLTLRAASVNPASVLKEE